MRNIDQTTGLDLNAWPNDLLAGDTVLLQANELGGDSTTTTGGTFGFNTRRLTEVAHLHVSGLVPNRTWNRAEVILLFNRTNASSGQFRLELQSWVVNHGGATPAPGSPQTSAISLHQDATYPVTTLQSIRVGVITCGDLLTLFRVKRDALHADDTSTSIIDVVGVLLRDADSVQIN